MTSKKLPEILLIWPGEMELNKKLLKDLFREGLHCVEYRPYKRQNKQEIVEDLKTLKQIIPIVLINNHVDLMNLVDGVWVGETDMPVNDIKKNLNFDKNKIIGKTVKTKTQLLSAIENGADAIGVGSVFSSRTKRDAFLTDWSIIEKIAQESTIPTFLVGGINVKNLCFFLEKHPLKNFRIAISSGILKTTNPVTSFIKLRELIQDFKKRHRIHSFTP